MSQSLNYDVGFVGIESFRRNNHREASLIQKGYTLPCKNRLSRFTSSQEVITPAKQASRARKAGNAREARIEIYMARHLLNKIMGTEVSLFRSKPNGD